MRDFAEVLLGGFILLLLVVFVIGGLMWGLPIYNVWAQQMSGRAQLAEAEWNRQIQIREAEANLESEKLNAQSEVERAKGAAQAIEIEAGTLTENYIKYLWIRQLSTGEKQLIYVPTEAGLPILEANRNQ
jgi:hypothetical protein